MSDQKRVLSCIQPTGKMHYGRYFGAVQNWVNLQEEYNCLYGVVDYHAMNRSLFLHYVKRDTSPIFRLLELKSVTDFMVLCCGRP